MAAAGWRQRFTRAVGHTKPARGTLRTLHDARAYTLALLAGQARRNAWQAAGRLALEAPDGGDLEAVTRQLELALMLEGADT